MESIIATAFNELISEDEEVIEFCIEYLLVKIYIKEFNKFQIIKSQLSNRANELIYTYLLIHNYNPDMLEEFKCNLEGEPYDLLDQIRWKLFKGTFDKKYADHIIDTFDEDEICDMIINCKYSENCLEGIKYVYERIGCPDIINEHVSDVILGELKKIKARKI